MSKLLSADFHRMIKSKLFYICAVAMCVFGIYLSSKMDLSYDLDELFFTFTFAIGIIMSVYVSLFLATEYSDGTIRNKMIVGHKRIDMFFSNFLMNIAAGLLFIICFMIPVFTIGVSRLGWFTNTASHIFGLIGICLFIVISFAAIFTVLGMLIASKGVAPVICLILVLFCMFVSLYMKSKLGQPEYINSYVESDTVVGTYKNPSYITGIRRDLYDIALDLTPSGQCISILFHRELIPNHAMLYSVAFTAIALSSGIILFKKKNIN